jgi:hypothetical protein
MDLIGCLLGACGVGCLCTSEDRGAKRPDRSLRIAEPGVAAALPAEPGSFVVLRSIPIAGRDGGEEYLLF